MRVIRNRNVNGNYAEGMELINKYGEQQESRAGTVLVAPWPVSSVYQKPRERVLFDETRDGNPFFHLMEGLWMLAGRDDAAFLDCYVRDFGKLFAEQCGRVHGAYGYRWRSEQAFGFDQLAVVVEKLKKNSQDRQAVIQMWDCRASDNGSGFASVVEMEGFEDLTGEFADRPCNTHVYLRVREQVLRDDPPFAPGPSSMRVLDLTVCCRSNDIIFGAYGSNAVHFSMLQEYLAGMIGVGVGTMYQFSNNYHAYVSVFEERHSGDANDPYDNAEVTALPMADDWSAWDGDLKNFMMWHDHLWALPGDSVDIDTPDGFANLWFHVVAGKMAACNWLWRQGRRDEAINLSAHIEAPDWSLAVHEWMLRRIDK